MENSLGDSSQQRPSKQTLCAVFRSCLLSFKLLFLSEVFYPGGVSDSPPSWICDHFLHILHFLRGAENLAADAQLVQVRSPGFVSQPYCLINLMSLGTGLNPVSLSVVY